jgi:hypothetical protein
MAAKNHSAPGQGTKELNHGWRIARMGKDSDIHVNRSTIMTSNRPLEE